MYNKNMNEKKNHFSSFVIAILIVIVSILAYQISASKSDLLSLTFLDVGQGDAALISNSFNQSILIDGGPSQDASNIVSKNLPFYQRKITTIILTHPHADHLNGLLDVIKNYEINNIYSTGVLHTTPEYLEFLNLVKDRNITYKVVKSGDKLKYEDGLELEVLCPYENLAGQKVDNLNNSSVVVRMTYGEMNSIFMGDLESEGQQKLFENLGGKAIESEIIKVAHHGSKDSVYQKLLGQIKPNISIFSVGKGNKFGHPHKTALDAFKATQIYRTDQDGTISFKLSKEKIISVNTD